MPPSSESDVESFLDAKGDPIHQQGLVDASTQQYGVARKVGTVQSAFEISRECSSYLHHIGTYHISVKRIKFMPEGSSSLLLSLLDEKAAPVIKLFDNIFLKERYISRDISRWSGLPKEQTIFRPFAVDVDGGRENEFFERNEEYNKFSKYLRRTINSHTILTGPSGAGKTYFMYKIVQNCNDYKFCFVNKYDNLIANIVYSFSWPDAGLVQRDDFLEEISEYNSRHRGTTVASVLLKPSRYIREFENDVWYEKFTNYINMAFLDDVVHLIVFDQMERFLASLSNEKSTDETSGLGLSGIDIVILFAILRLFRSKNNVHTVFIIRSDALNKAIDFLSCTADVFLNNSHCPKLSEASAEKECMDNKDCDDRLLAYYYFNGVNIHNAPGAVQQIRSRFEIARGGTAIDWDAFVKFTNISSPNKSNTFMIQMTGYMIEHFGREDGRVSRIISENKDLYKIMPVFFEHLISGFYKNHPKLMKVDIFKAILLTISIENKRAGEAITRKRAAGLCHLPISYIDAVFEYLLSTHVVIPDVVEEEKGKKEPGIRFVHDKLFDHIIQAEEFTLRPNLLKAIERLSERKIPTNRLLTVDGFGSLWDFNFISVILYVFFVWGAVIIVSAYTPFLENSAIPVMREISRWLLDTIGYPLSMLGIDTSQSKTSIVQRYYPFIYLSHVFWISYMYYLYKGYFKYAMRASRAVHVAAMSLPVIGVTLGIEMSFSPQLYVFPITIVGLVMGFILMVFSFGFKKNILFGRLNWLWGKRTALNMFFVSLLYFLFKFMISSSSGAVGARNEINKNFSGANEALQLLINRSPDWLRNYMPGELTIEFLTFLFSGCLLIWFWIHIRLEQQSEISMADRLATYDRVRNVVDDK